MMADYHIPALLEESIEGLEIKADGIYVDLTFGGGGHSKVILEKLVNGHLYAFDQDEEAGKNAQKIDSRSFTFIKANFRYLKKYLRVHGMDKVDGILADLGISSHQLNEAYRGFSTRSEGPLDMRMNQNSGVTASDLIAKIEEHDLRQALRNWGDLKNASAVAGAICQARVNAPITSTQQLIEVIEPFALREKQNKFFAQVFQALRMEVNEELPALEEMLFQGTDILGEKGRFVILSYHSLEDRMVKNFFNKGKIKGEVEKDFYGNLLRPLVPINKKPIMATESEINNNKRARSAKLRIAQKG